MKSSTKVSTRGGQLGHWAGANQTAHEDDNLELCVSLTETLSSFSLNQQHVPMEGFSHPCMPCYFHGFSCVFFDILGTEASTICLLTIYFTCVALTLKNIFNSERWNLLTEAGTVGLLLNPARPLLRFLGGEKLLPVTNLKLFHELLELQQ